MLFVILILAVIAIYWYNWRLKEGVLPSKEFREYTLIHTVQDNSSKKTIQRPLQEPVKQPAKDAADGATVEEGFNFENLNIIQGKIGIKGTLYDALIAEKVPHGIIGIIVSKLRTLVDYRKCNSEDQFTVWISDDGVLVKFAYQRNPLEIYEVKREGGRYIAYEKMVPVDRYLVKVCGKIRSSLFEAVNEIDERDQLAIDFADIFAWEIDFYKDVQAGDQFKIIVEKIFKGDEFIQYGKLLAAEYRTSSQVFRGFYFEGSDGKADYFDEKGHSLRKAFLRSPLRYTRISSRYSYSRKHPILGGLRPHYGVDYAAPHGTPIWSVADGIVVKKEWSKAYGWYLAIRYPNGYTSYYGHLSRFAKGIKKGIRVKQKQIIGYVGSTGYSTGPHLDYRLKRYSRYRNPLMEKFPSGRPVPKGDLERYMGPKNTLLQILEDDSLKMFKMKESGDIEDREDDTSAQSPIQVPPDTWHLDQLL